MMASEYLKNKYDILKSISEGCSTFSDIVWYTNLMPVRIRGILRYFMSRNDILKSRQNSPTRYELTLKGEGKLNYWELKKKKGIF
jgi:predicted transcriptional regulator